MRVFRNVVVSVFLCLSAAAHAEAWIINGTDWKDTNGNPISCHEGGMSRFGDTFYWYGTSCIGNPKGICGKRQQEQGLRRGLNVYSSRDLANWKYEGVALDFDRPGNEIKGSGHRPSVIYNARTKQYVMWFFDFTKYPAPMMAVAVSESPVGPFRIHARDVMTGEEHGWAQDCALFTDDDGKAYLAYDDGHRNLRVDLLSDDYLSSTGKSVIALPKAPSPDKDRGHEGTAFAKYKGKYIIAGSGVRGWHGTPTHYAVADSPLGPYSEKDCMSNDNTWGSQISNFIHIKETDTLMAVCDQWARIHGPDCKLCASWPGDDTTVKELDASRYLWLPVEFDRAAGRARMLYKEKWKPLDFTIRTALYVDPNGDDSAPGTKEKPLATLPGARDAVRKLIAADGGTLKKPVTVYFRGGVYRFKETMVFGLEDSGSADATITYAAYENETPVFSGGVPVQSWKKTDLKDGKIWSADVPWVKDGRGFHALFDGGKLLQRARSSRFANTRVMVRGPKGWGESEGPRTERYLKTRDDRYTKLDSEQTLLANTRNIGDVEVFMRPSAKWLVNYLPVKSFNPEWGVLETTIKGTYPLAREFYLENALEYLDEAGEWSLNTQEGKLYYWPESGNPGDNIEAPVLPALVRVEGKNVETIEGDVPVRGLTFRGLTFTLCNRDVWTKDDIGIQHDWDMYDKDNTLLRFRGAEDCGVDGCRFVNSGSGAVRVDLYGQRIRIENNTIRNMGGVGILLAGYGPGVKDVNRNNLILNNHIEKCGTLYWHGLGVNLWQSGENRVAHNRIHDLGYMGMVVSGVRMRFWGVGRFAEGQGDDPNLREVVKTIRRSETVNAGKDENWDNYQPYMHARRNLIEYNEIYNCMQRLTDGNCIYLSATGEDNIVRRNLVHSHVKNSMIRADDDQYKTHVIENVLIGNVSPYGYALKRVNTFENNVLVQSMIYGEGAGGGPETGAKILRNIIYAVNPELQSFVNARMFKTLRKEDIDYNIYFMEGADKAAEFLGKMQKDGWDKHGVAADPLFVDIHKLDFTLKPESPALKLGFKPIEGLDTIGLLKDPALPRLRQEGGLDALMKVEAHPSEVFLE